MICELCEVNNILNIDKEKQKQNLINVTIELDKRKHAICYVHVNAFW